MVYQRIFLAFIICLDLGVCEAISLTRNEKFVFASAKQAIVGYFLGCGIHRFLILLVGFNLILIISR